MSRHAEADVLAKHRAGGEITPEDTCSTIECEAELEGYRHRLKLDGRLTAAALHAIAKRQHALRAAKGVRGYGA